MAATWTVTDIIPIDIDNFVASIVATWDDGNGNVSTYTVPRAVIETVPQQQDAMREILAKRAADKVESDQVAAFVNSRKAAGKIYLEANDNG